MKSKVFVTLFVATVLILNTNSVVDVYAQQGGVVSPSGTGSSIGIPPTLGLLDDNRIMHDGITINNKAFSVEYFTQELPLTTVSVGEPVNISLKIYENRGIDELRHVELNLGTYTHILAGMVPVEEAQAVIIWDKTNPGFDVIDDTDLIDNVDVNTTPIDDNIRQIDFSFEFSRVSEPMTIKTTVWNEKRSSWNNYFVNSIDVIGTPIVSQIPDPLAVAETINKRLTITPDDHLSLNEQARIHIGNEQNQEAKIVLDKILEINQNDISARNGLAATHFNEENYSEAINQLNFVLGMDSNNEYALALKSLALAELGLHDEASKIREKVFKINPENVYAILSQAIELQDKGKYLESSQFSQRALDLDANFHHSLIVHAETLSNLNNPIGALEHYEKAVEILPTNYVSMYSQQAIEDTVLAILVLAVAGTFIASAFVFRHTFKKQLIISKKK